MNTKQTPKITTIAKHGGDTHYATALTAAMHELLPTKRADYDTTRQDARNRAQLAQAIDLLPSEDLAFLSEIARLIAVCPEQIQDAISYNSDQSARFRAAMVQTGGDARAAYAVAFAAD